MHGRNNNLSMRQEGLLLAYRLWMQRNSGVEYKMKSSPSFLSVANFDCGSTTFNGFLGSPKRELSRRRLFLLTFIWSALFFMVFFFIGRTTSDSVVLIGPRVIPSRGVLTVHERVYFNLSFQGRSRGFRRKKTAQWLPKQQLLTPTAMKLWGEKWVC